MNLGSASSYTMVVFRLLCGCRPEPGALTNGTSASPLQARAAGSTALRGCSASDLAPLSRIIIEDMGPSLE
jgi:hypothetical protein